MNFKTGDAVLIEYGEAATLGHVVFASGNGRLLMLGFEAIIEGHVGMMPVLRDDDGTYRSIVNDITVKLTARQ